MSVEGCAYRTGLVPRPYERIFLVQWYAYKDSFQGPYRTKQRGKGFQ